MADEVVATKKEPKIKTVALSPAAHAKLIALQKELKTKSIGILIEKLVDEYEEVRK